jgi:hypothetical protein
VGQPHPGASREAASTGRFKCRAPPLSTGSGGAAGWCGSRLPPLPAHNDREPPEGGSPALSRPRAALSASRRPLNADPHELQNALMASCMACTLA